MPRGSKLDDSQATAPLRPSSPQPEKPPLVDRLRNAVVKPVQPDTASTARSGEPRVREELEAAVRSADDKERLVGLIAAPLAAAIGVLVISALISNDPSALLRNGEVNKLHVSLSVYESLAGVLLTLSVLMLGTAMFRKRLLLGIVMALYGLAVFNLHYWGFGLPFILGGAWLLVRAYRLQRDLREASNEPAARRGRVAPVAARPQPRKRPKAQGSARRR